MGEANSAKSASFAPLLPPKTSEGDLDVVEKAKRIRKILRQHFPNHQFKVRSDRYSMGESIDVTWTDGPASEKVEALGLQGRFEHVDKDERTGEILNGCNSFVFLKRNYTDTSYQAAADKVWNRFVEGTFTSRNDPQFTTQVWQELEKTDL